MKSILGAVCILVLYTAHRADGYMQTMAQAFLDRTDRGQRCFFEVMHRPWMTASCSAHRQGSLPTKIVFKFQSHGAKIWVLIIVRNMHA